MGQLDITIEELKAMLSYDPDTGIFTRIKQSSNSKIGKELGSKHSAGYVVIGFKSKNRFAHRLAWLYMTGEWPTKQIDHINGNRSDNRFVNLRVATQSENNQNKKTASSKSTTGLLGVCRHKNGFGAMIRVNGISKWIGLYKTAEEAHAAYLTEKRKVHPFNTI